MLSTQKILKELPRLLSKQVYHRNLMEPHQPGRSLKSEQSTGASRNVPESPQNDTAIRTALLEESSEKESWSPPLQTRPQLFFFLLKTTSLWALGGIAFMMIGIISAWIFIKKRVYVCPPSAACPSSINPDNSFLQDIRTVMQYWLHVGMLIFGVGLVKLVAYQAWSAMQQRGNTIDILGLNIGVVKGSASDAANLLLLRRRNRSLGVFVLAHIAIITAISFVVGKSITTVTDAGSVDLSFYYPMNISFLNENGGFSVTEFGPTWVWLYKDAADLNALYNETYSGTFIIQDSRAEYGINARPSGQRISGSVSCVDPSANIKVNTTQTEFDATGILSVNIYYHDRINTTEITEIKLEPSNFAIGMLTGYPYLFNVTRNTFVWFTTTEGIIPNAIKFDFNYSFQEYPGLFIGLCEHTITFPNLPQNDASGNEMQDINPSQPILYLSPGQEKISIPSLQSDIVLTPANPLAICDDLCLSGAVWITLLSFWGLDTTGSVLYCYGGVLTPVGVNNMNQSCPSLDGEMWNRTLALVLDGMLHTLPRFGNTLQTLSAHAESIGTWHWWLQGIIPLSAFILYVVCLAYTVTVYWAGETMKELDLLEVVNATRAEDELEILTKSVMVGGKLKKQVENSS